MKVKTVSIPAVTKIVEIEPAREEVILTLTEDEAQLLRAFVRGGVSIVDTADRLEEVAAGYNSLRSLPREELRQRVEALMWDFHGVGVGF